MNKDQHFHLPKGISNLESLKVYNFLKYTEKNYKDSHK